MTSGLIFKSLINFEFILVYGVRRCSNFVFCMYLSNFPHTIYWIDCHCPIVCSWLLCQMLIDRKVMGLFLGSPSCSIDLYVWFYASTMLFWLLWLCSIVWHQVVWHHQFHSSFSRLLWLFGVFCVSIQIFGIFVLVLWNMPLVSWEELCWIFRLLWVVWTF